MPSNYPEGVVISFGANLNLIPAAIRVNGCCEILTMGHQNLTQRGITSIPGKGQRVVVFPNEALEKEIAKAFKDAGCKGGKIFNYACAPFLDGSEGAGVADPNGEMFDKVRFSIAKNTGCDVYGLRGEYFKVDGVGLHSPNCKNWPKVPGGYNACTIPDLSRWPAK